MYYKKLDSNKRNFIYVLTNDYFFFSGLSEIFPDKFFIQVPFNNLNSRCYLRMADSNIFILIDSRIMICDDWSGYRLLNKIHPYARQFLLIHRSSERYITKDRLNQGCISYLQLSELRQRLHAFMTDERQNANIFQCQKLSVFEEDILTYLTDDITIEKPSCFLECSEKTMYRNRMNISHKFGFRSFVYLQLFLKNAPPDIYEKRF